MRAETTANTARFDAFEVDLDSGELRRAGVHIPLGEQPTQVLLALLRRPGSLVTREELRAALWPPNTFVEDADQGLNAAVKRLRDALDDHADEPRYIETVPRRGYRFASAIAREPAGDAIAPVAEAGSARRRSRPRVWIGVALLVPLALGLAYVFRQRSPSAGAPAPLVRVTSIRSLTEHTVALPPFWVELPLVTDGPRLWIPEATKGLQTREVPAAGGVTVPRDFGLGWSQVVEAVSPDGSELLVSTERDRKTWRRPYWIAPSTAGGTPRRLGGIAGDSAFWLPDGRILFMKAAGPPGAAVPAPGDVAVCITDRDGREERVIAWLKDRAYWPRMAPDGRRVRVSVHDRFDKWSMVDVDIASGGVTPVTFSGRRFEDSCCGVWTASGRVFVFQAWRALDTQLWAVLRDEHGESAPIQLTQGSVSYLRPLPSLDGKRLFAVGRHLKGELVRYDTATAGFVSHPLNLSAQWVEFSRDGRWVAYVTYPDGELWRARSDGSERLRLTRGSDVFNVHWSPDAATLVFNEVEPDTGRFRMIRIGRDGGNRADLGLGENPTWSPDGASLVFGRGEGLKRPRGIHIRELATGQERMLPESGPFFGPRWSPDGRYLAAQDDRDMSLALYDVGTSRWSRLAPGYAWYPTWSSDSTTVYYSHPSRGRGGVMDSVSRVALATREIETVWVNRDMRLAGGLPPIELPWFGLDHEDRLLLVRDLSTHDVYALDLAYDDK